MPVKSKPAPKKLSAAAKLRLLKRLRCTLVARWYAGYADPWLVVTDLPPPTDNVV